MTRAMPRASQSRLRLGTKGLLLFLLPLPLAIGAAWDLIGGDFADLVLSSGLFLLFMLGAVVNRQGLLNEARLAERRLTQGSRIPFKTIGAGLVALASGLTAHWAIGHGIAMSVGYAVAALFGCYFAYGFDILGAKGPVGADADAARAAVALDEAYARLRRIEDNNRAIRDREINERVRGIHDWAQKVLVEIEKDPRDIRHARKFLKVYLEGAEQVTQRFASLDEQPLSVEVEHNFRTLLVDMENVFAELHQKLKENDILDLDIQIEVLSTRLRREGVI